MQRPEGQPHARAVQHEAQTHSGSTRLEAPLRRLHRPDCILVAVSQRRLLECAPGTCGLIEPGLASGPLNGCPGQSIRCRQPSTIAAGQFFAGDIDVERRFNAQPYDIALNLDHGQGDGLANKNAFTFLACRTSMMRLQCAKVDAGLRQSATPVARRARDE